LISFGAIGGCDLDSCKVEVDGDCVDLEGPRPEIP